MRRTHGARNVWYVLRKGAPGTSISEDIFLNYVIDMNTLPPIIPRDTDWFLGIFLSHMNNLASSCNIITFVDTRWFYSFSGNVALNDPKPYQTIFLHLTHCGVVTPYCVMDLRSTLALVMACWHQRCSVLWYSHGSNFPWNTNGITLEGEFENNIFKIAGKNYQYIKAIVYEWGIHRYLGNLLLIWL